MVPTEPTQLSLPSSVFIILRDLIQDRTGVTFADDKREVLAEKLKGRVKALALDSYLDYFYLLRYGESAEREWAQVHDAIAVPETYFWREIDQVWALVQRVLPELAVSGKPITIWSAASASGEEPLTLAMVLEQTGWFEKADIRILASDASPQAIERAKAGRYNERSCRHLPALYRERYFEADGSGWKIRPEIQRRVTWHTANLLDRKQLEPFLQSSIVFCRNVFIYFSRAAIQETVNVFSQALPRPTFLFLGVAESLVGQTTDFELEHIDNAFVYVRR